MFWNSNNCWKRKERSGVLNMLVVADSHSQFNQCYPGIWSWHIWNIHVWVHFINVLIEVRPFTSPELFFFLIFKASALWADAFYKSKCPFVCVSVCSLIWTFFLENCLKSPRKKKVFFFTFFGLLRFLVFFKGLFAPTSWSRMSNTFRDLESLEKSNGKKWSQIWTFLLKNCLKSPLKKKFFSPLFLVFFGFRSFLKVFLPPLSEVGCPIFLKIWNPWGKVMERSGLRYEHVCLKIV